MEALTAPTHDLDLLAIQKRIKDHEVNIGSPFTPSEEKDKIKEQIAKLNQLREGILVSGLEAIYDFAIFGTENSRDIVKYNGDPLKFNFRKFKDYIQNAYLWELVKQGELDIDDIKKKRAQLLGGLGNNIQEIKTNTLGLMSRIMTENPVYRQGDEFLHNMAFNRVYNDPISQEDSKERTVIFDADHAIISSLAGAQAKLLFNHVSNLDPEDAYAIIDKAKSYAQERIKDAIKKGIINNPEVLKLDNTERIRRNLDYTAIFEIICCLGRRAQDALKNREFHDKKIRIGVQYNNPFIPEDLELPNYVNLAQAYEIDPSIERLRSSLRNFFDRITSDKVDYEVTKQDRATIDGLEKLVTKFDIL